MGKITFYQEKLKDPRWQKMRLCVFERDEFSCQWRGSADKTLHAHHLVYSGNPWDAPIRSLITLCEDCHVREHAEREKRESDIISALAQSGYSSNHMDWLTALLVQPQFKPDDVLAILTYALKLIKKPSFLKKIYSIALPSLYKEEHSNIALIVRWLKKNNSLNKPKKGGPVAWVE